MSRTHFKVSRLLIAAYWIYNPTSKGFIQPLSIRFHSTATDRRTLNDIAARYAREEGIVWDMIIITDVNNVEVSRRVRKSLIII